MGERTAQRARAARQRLEFGADVAFCVRAYRAVDERDTSLRYHDGHVQALASYGVGTIPSSSQQWLDRPDVVAVVAERGEQLLGGVRLHKTGGAALLPLEESVGDLDDRLFEIVKQSMLEGSGEACGLWCARGTSMWSVSLLLMQAVVALAQPLGIRTLFGLGPDHTLRLFERVGFRVVDTLGDDGGFVYPTREYTSKVIQMDAETLVDALPPCRRAMLALRSNLVQTRTEPCKAGLVDVAYALRVADVP